MAIHLVTQIRESPDIGEIHGKADDGQEEVNVGVPRHAVALAVVHDHG